LVSPADRGQNMRFDQVNEGKQRSLCVR
jgi:hypothetical protein